LPPSNALPLGTPMAARQRLVMHSASAPLSSSRRQTAARRAPRFLRWIPHAAVCRPLCGRRCLCSWAQVRWRHRPAARQRTSWASVSLFGDSFFGEIVGILHSVCSSVSRRHHRSPTQASKPAGQDPRRALGAPDRHPPLRRLSSTMICRISRKRCGGRSDPEVFTWRASIPPAALASRPWGQRVRDQSELFGPSRWESRPLRDPFRAPASSLSDPRPRQLFAPSPSVVPPDLRDVPRLPKCDGRLHEYVALCRSCVFSHLCPMLDRKTESRRFGSERRAGTKSGFTS
jgi:hypothetical protein